MKKLTLFLKISFLTLRNFRCLVKTFSREHFRILKSAIRSEHPAKILHNIRRFISSNREIGSTVSNEHTSLFHTSSSGLSSESIIFHVGKATYSKSTRELIIGGWAIDFEGIKLIEVYCGSILLGTAELGGPRSDVGETFPRYQESHKSGFNFYAMADISSGEMYLKIANGLNQWRLVSIGIDYARDSLSINHQYKIVLGKQPPVHIKRKQWKRSLQSLKYLPAISIVTPVYNTSPEHLESCIQSVINQVYPHWQLCLYDDGSSSSETLEILRKFSGQDPRIDIMLGKENKNISIASNMAISLARGDYIGFLDHDDELTPDALLQMALLLNADPALDFIYSDEDKIDENGIHCDPHYKSDYNPDLLLSNNYICHFAVVRKSIGAQAGWFRQGFEGSQDFDLFLRIISRTNKIAHIPKILYHWRKTNGSAAKLYQEKGFADSASRKAIQDHLEMNSIDGIVENGLYPGSFRVKRSIQSPGKVSIIIPFKDEVSLLRKCVKSLLKKTIYKDIEVLFVSNNSSDQATFRYIKQVLKADSRFKFYELDIPFNYSAINNWAVHKTAGEWVLLLNNDTEIISDGWLSAMIEHIQRPEVGAVGAKLLYPDDTVQHAGVILKINGVAGHAHKYIPDQMPGYFYRANVIQNFSAVTGACLLLKKDLFLKVGGLDESNLPIAFNDIDLCLKIRNLGKLIVYTPYAKLYHHESKSRGSDQLPERVAQFQEEIKFFQNKWEEVLQIGDPYYNKNLGLTSEQFDLNI